MSKLPEKFTIPKDRIPHAFAQGAVGACVAISLTKILEVINYIKTGEYEELSKGYVYGRHNHHDKRQDGMDYTYALNSLLKCGSVPADMYTYYDEMPEIRDRLFASERFSELEKAAEKTKIKAWEKIEGNAYKFENIKKYLCEHQMPLIGNMTGSRTHCTVIVGYDGDKLLYQGHDVDGKITSVRHTKFNYAFYIDGGVEEKEAEPTPQPPDGDSSPCTGEPGQKGENDMGYKLMNVNEFKNYLDSLNISRRITVVQLHHTYSPSYAQFTGNNHIALQNAMRDYHVKTRGFADIAQTFTIFPDGKICTGRDINSAPAGIYGANSTGVCIECLGNFDKGGDTMTKAQKNAVIAVTRMLLDRLGLNARTGVTYHSWWTDGGTNLGTYLQGKSAKTCPGTNFFGGNTRQAYEKNLMPLIESYGKLESGNDIVWELMNGKLKVEITEVERAVKALDKAKKNAEFSSLYWIIYKIVNNR